MRKLIAYALLTSCIADAAGPGGKGITAEQLFTQIYNFSILFGLLFILLRKPILNALANRREEFLKQKNVSQNLLRQAKESLREISDRTSLLEKNFNADLQRAKQEALAFKKNQVSGAKETSERIIAEAKKNLGYEKEKYVEMIKVELLETATTSAKADLKENLKSSDQKRLQSESFERFQEVRP